MRWLRRRRTTKLGKFYAAGDGTIEITLEHERWSLDDDVQIAGSVAGWTSLGSLFRVVAITRNLDDTVTYRFRPKATQ